MPEYIGCISPKLVFLEIDLHGVLKWTSQVLIFSINFCNFFFLLLQPILNVDICGLKGISIIETVQSKKLLLAFL